MLSFNSPIKSKKNILALGAESAGNFSVYQNNQLYFSEDFGDLLEEKNWKKYQASVLKYFKENKIKPDIILTDLHPIFNTTLWGQTLARKYKAKHIQIQHHLAHIFSAIGDKIIQDIKYKIPNTVFGLALDGTGYGLDGKIWGGEIFKLQTTNHKLQAYRIGHLENQTMLGGELAIKEPARILIGILNKMDLVGRHPERSEGSRDSSATPQNDKKKFIYSFVKKYYSCNEFEVLYNQLKQNFNCQETSSAGRILDAVSILLGLCGNKRNYKHEPIFLLEANSSKPYKDVKPRIDILKNNMLILNTTFLFKYLIKNLHKDKKRLAATAQLYIAEGLYKIIEKLNPKSYKLKASFMSGGISNNKIIRNYLESKGFFANKKIYPVKLQRGEVFNGVPRGDAGISFGQIIYYFLG